MKRAAGTSHADLVIAGLDLVNRQRRCTPFDAIDQNRKVGGIGQNAQRAGLDHGTRERPHFDMLNDCRTGREAYLENTLIGELTDSEVVRSGREDRDCGVFPAALPPIMTSRPAGTVSTLSVAVVGLAGVRR